MLLNLTPNGGTPLYIQFCEQLRRLIISGLLSPGTQMPSVREFAVEYSINPMTVSKVYSILKSEGFLSHSPGMSMVVNPKLPNELDSERIQRLNPLISELALAAKQLNVPVELVILELEKSNAP